MKFLDHLHNETLYDIKEESLEEFYGKFLKEAPGNLEGTIGQ